MMLVVFFFFFKAEDGIRGVAVTGVQTCALPISFISTQESFHGPPYPHRTLSQHWYLRAHRCRQDHRSEEHTSELQSRLHLVCRLLLEKKKQHPFILKLLTLFLRSKLSTITRKSR